MPALLRRRLAAALTLGLSLAAGLAGCAKTRTADADTLPPNKLQALMEGDRLISDGQDRKEQGMRLRGEGKGGDDLIQLGEEEITRGEKMKADGMMMRD